MSNFSISNNRQWYDIVQDGNGGESNRIQGNIIPSVSVNTSIDANSRKILSAFYYDSNSKCIRKSFDRSPDMEFQNISNLSTLTNVNNVIGYTNSIDNSNNHYYYTDNTKLYSESSNIALSTLSTNISNVKIKKYLTSTTSYIVLSVGSNLYSISGNSTISHTQLVNDYDGRDFSPYIDEDTQITYIAYTNSSGIQVLTPFINAGPVILLKAKDYSGSGNWLDQSGNGYDATLENGTIAKNSNGNGIVLDGSTNWTFPNIAAGNAWTASVWFKQTGPQVGETSGNGACILGQSPGYGAPVNISIGDNAQVNNGELECGFFNSNNSWYDGASFRLTQNVWTNIQASWNGTILKTYINGVLYDTYQPGAISTDSGDVYRIGRRWDSANYMTGEIGEVRIYNYALTQAQVTTDYQSSYSTFFIFNPLSVLGCQLWLDASDTTSIVSSGSSPAKVSQWNDKSGNGYNMTNSTVANQPILQPPESGQNGLNIVDFSGTTSLDNANMNFPNAPYSIFIVAYSNNTSSSGNGLLLYAQPDCILFMGSSGINYSSYIGAGNSWTNTNPNTPLKSLNSWSLIELTNNGTNGTPYINGTSLDVLNGNTISGTGLFIGSDYTGAQNWNGPVSEILIYNNLLSTYQRQVIEGYLAWKWGLQTNLSNSHPFYNNPPNVNTLNPVILLKAVDYSGSGSWLDQSGNGKNATLENGVIAKNIDGNGIVLNGSTSWTFPNVAVGNAWTAGVWFKNTGASNNTCLLTQIFTGSPMNLIIGNIIDNSFQGGFYNLDTRYSGNSFTFTNGNWTNVQVTWNGTNLSTYINGVLLGTVQYSVTSVDSENAYRIGRLWDGASYITGEIGEVRIYKYAISQAQVSFDYLSSYDTFMFNPTVIPGLQLWFDAADTSSLVIGGSGSTVTQWKDKSGLDNNTTSIVGTPKYSPGTGIKFDGISCLDGSVSITNDKVTVLAVSNLNSGGGNQRLISLAAPGVNDYDNILYFGMMTDNGNGIGPYRNSQRNPVNPPNVSQSYITDSWFDGSNEYTTTLMGNSTSINTYASSGNFCISRYTIGSDIVHYPDRYFAGSISEIIIYNKTLTTYERQAVEGYLAWKWNLQLNLPNTHPFYNYPPQVNSLSPVVLLKAIDYSGSGAWLDESGNGRNATLEDGQISRNTAGNGIVLDGSTSWTFPNVGVSSNWTVNVWYKKTGSSTNAGCIINQIINNNNDVNIMIGDLYNNGVTSTLFFADSWHSATDFVLPLNQWINIQATLDGTNLSTFINGNLIGTVQTGPSRDSGNAYRIGRRFDVSWYVIGEIGEVRIYNYPLTQAQVTTDYLESVNTFIFDPTIISGCQLWFDGADPLGNRTEPSNGTSVTTWVDKSENRYNTSAVNGNPTYTSNSGIIFDGSSYFNLPNNAMPYGDSSYSIFIVAKATYGAIINGGFNNDNGYPNLSTRYYGTSINVTWWHGNDYNITESTSDICLFNTAYGSGGNMTATYNGIVLTSYSPPGVTRTQANTNNFIGSLDGGGTTLSGTISEILVFNINLDIIQRQFIEGSLAWKWGLQTQLPSNHPYYNNAPPTNNSGPVILLKAKDYSGSGAWHDKSGHGRDATLENGVIAKNSDGNGIVLDGSTNWIFPNVAVGNSWTASVWWKNTGNPIGWNGGIGACILTQITNGDVNLAIGDIINGGLNNGVYAGGGAWTGGWYTGSSFSFTNGKWTNIQVTWDGTNMSTFINGSLIGTLLLGGIGVDSGNNYRIGHRWDTDSYMIGEIGEVRIYNYPLTPKQVSADYLSSYDTFMFNPTSITGCQLWLDGADTSSLVLSGSSVTQWKDKSGLHNNTTSVSGTAPKYSPGSGLVFTGNGLLNLPDSSIPYSDSSYSIYIVSSRAYNASGPMSPIICSGSLAGTNSNLNIFYRETAISTDWYASEILSPLGNSINSKIVYSSLYQSGSTCNVYFNGGNHLSDTLGTRSQTNNNNALGGRTDGYAYMTGTISEILVYNTNHTTYQRQIVEGYLSWKWNLQSQLPNTHPFYNSPPQKISFTQTILLKAINYSGTGVWHDESGNGKNATKTAGTIAKNTTGNGIMLDGSTYWTFPNVAVGNAWTIGVWYKDASNGVYPANQCIVTQQQAGANPTVNIALGFGYAPSGKCFIGQYNGDWNLGPVASIDNTWINIQATWDGTSVILYKNGVQIATSNFNGNPSIDSGNSYFIGCQWNADNFITGEIGEVRIYNYPLSQQQVTADYQSSYKTFMFNPTVITGCQLWLDGADQTTVTLSSTNVTQWSDKSGSSNNATSVQGLTTYNKEVGLKFNGTSYFNLPNGTLPYGDSSYSIYIVASAASSIQQGLIGGGTSGTGQILSLRYYDDANQNTILTIWYGQDITSSIILTPAKSFLFNSLYQSGSNRTVWANGSAAGSDTPGTPRTQPNTNNVIGTNPYSIGTGILQGTISEILVYNTNHSTYQRQVVEGYLSWKWNLQSQLPNTHPFYNNPPQKDVFNPLILLKAINYSGSGAWLDESGNGRNATLENGTIAKNSAGNGIVLNGSTNWIFPNVAVSNSWTANVWYKNTGSQSGYQNGIWASILTQIQVGSYVSLNIGDINGENNGTLYAGIMNIGNNWIRGSGFNLTNGNWTNIQVTWDGINLSTYINSLLIGTVIPGIVSPDAGSSYRIGRRCDSESYMTGEIGEVRIYNYPLTQSQVTANYNASVATFTNSGFNRLTLNSSNPFNMSILATLPLNQYSNPRIIKFKGILYLFVVNTIDNCIYSTTINNSTKIATILNQFKEASDYKISVINNKLILTCVNPNGNLNRMTVGNNALQYYNFIKTNVPVNAFDICNINDEEFIFYIGSDKLLHQVWNPSLFIDVHSDKFINTFSVLNFTDTTNSTPSFNLSINDYYLTSTTTNNLVVVKISITNILGNNTTITYKMYPGQCLHIYDFVNHYYVKLLPSNVTVGSNITKNTGYIPGYYLSASTFGGNSSDYYFINDSNGVPVWYRRTTSDPNFTQNPQVCSLFLGMGKNRVVTDIFDVNRTRTIIDVSSLIEENYKVVTPDTRGNIVDWDVHEALEVKNPIERRGNMIFGSYVSGGFYFQEQNKNHQIVWEFWSSDLINPQYGDYFHFNSIDIHPLNGNLVISFRNCSTIACINYETKNIDWAIDPTGAFATVVITSSLTKFLTPTNEPLYGGYQYNGTQMQHDARWHYDTEPLTRDNDVISAYDDQSGSGWAARGVIYEIDLVNNNAIHRGSVFSPTNASSGYMGSYKVQREINGSYSHVVDYVQQHNNLYEYQDDGSGMPTGNVLLSMDFPGDLYRISKARPIDLDINIMRKTSGMPISTLLDVGQLWNVAAATNVTVNSLTSVTKTVATSAYDTQIYSIVSYIKPSFSIQLTTLTPSSATGLGVFGISENPSTGLEFDTINYGMNIDLNGPFIQIHELGVYISQTTITDVNSIYEINFDGVNVNYLINGVSVRSVARKSYNPLYCNLCIFEGNLTLDNIYFNQYHG